MANTGEDLLAPTLLKIPGAKIMGCLLNLPVPAGIKFLYPEAQTLICRLSTIPLKLQINLTTAAYQREQPTMMWHLRILSRRCLAG